MRWIVFEDDNVSQLYPIALARPVFELVCGRESLRRRLRRWFPAAQWGVCLRPWLADDYAEKQPTAAINNFSQLSSEQSLFVNGRWLPERRFTDDEVRLNNVGMIDGRVAWIALEPEEAMLLEEGSYAETLQQIARTRTAVQASGILLNWPWDLVHHNGRQLERDFIDEGVSQPFRAEHVQCLGDARDAYISEQADIDPYVVIDTRTGPVSIDRDVHIQSFTRIEGPCHIARGARILRASIRGGTTIGPHCRIGGEIEESILHAYVNKYHDGFIGHSYVCPWVNLGAMTTTSDLRNDYGTVSVPLQGELIHTGLCKVGSFIGDHARTAIDSMFNTGSSVGVMALVLPGGRLLPRHIPSFCNLNFGELAADWPIEQGLQAAHAAMQRRGRELTSAGQNLLRKIYQMTAEERSQAVNLAQQKREQRTTFGRT